MKIILLLVLAIPLLIFLGFFANRSVNTNITSVDPTPTISVSKVFNEISFREDAKKNGYSDEEIDSYLIVQGIINAKPSDRALQVASTYYVDLSADDQTSFLNDNTNGSKSPTEAIRNFAILLDRYPEKLALFEAQHNQYEKMYYQSDLTQIQQMQIDLRTLKNHFNL